MTGNSCNSRSSTQLRDFRPNFARLSLMRSGRNRTPAAVITSNVFIRWRTEHRPQTSSARTASMRRDHPPPYGPGSEQLHGRRTRLSIESRPLPLPLERQRSRKSFHDAADTASVHPNAGGALAASGYDDSDLIVGIPMKAEF
jgi:hypothetical protein